MVILVRISPIMPAYLIRVNELLIKQNAHPMALRLLINFLFSITSNFLV